MTMTMTMRKNPTATTTTEWSGVAMSLPPRSENP